MHECMTRQSGSVDGALPNNSAFTHWTDITDAPAPLPNERVPGTRLAPSHTHSFLCYDERHQ
jgi:hypothetical protein